MTTVSSTRELSDGRRVIDASYRSRSDLSRLSQLTSSSSSSSVSGVTTPVDGISPKLIAFPKSSPPKPGLTSSGSSSSSLDRHRVRSLSFSRVPQSPTQRTLKLSFGSAKATPTPAVTSAPEEHQPLGAFSLTSSAEGHLRSLVTRVISPPRTSSKVSDTLQRSTFTKRERASSLRSFPIPWASISDIDEEEEGETFWPRQKGTLMAHHHDEIPSLSRSPSTPKGSDTDGPSSSPGTGPVRPILSSPRTRFASERSVTVPRFEATQTNFATLRKSGQHVRANSFTSPSAQPRAVSSLRLEETGASTSNAPVTAPRTFLRPPVRSRKGKSPARLPAPGNSVQTKESTTSTTAHVGMKNLDPALAAAENASRLRARCVCVVCGKLGVDFPRCPRCSTTWCSRSCRVSDAPAGSARHSCNGKSKTANGKRLASPNPKSSLNAAI